LTKTLYFVLQENASKQLATTLYGLENTIAQRKSEEAILGSKPSWTKRLIENPALLCSKIRYVFIAFPR
jgi:phosphoribosyl-ATP pyrophosphohydrolase/phosphoribosyl-AMP cyclohydrolase